MGQFVATVKQSTGLDIIAFAKSLNRDVTKGTR